MSPLRKQFAPGPTLPAGAVSSAVGRPPVTGGPTGQAIDPLQKRTRNPTMDALKKRLGGPQR